MSKLSNRGTYFYVYLWQDVVNFSGKVYFSGKMSFFGGNYFDKFKTIGTKSAVPDKFYIHTTFDVEVGKV